jgi:hypothetical protein
MMPYEHDSSVSLLLHRLGSALMTGVAAGALVYFLDRHLCTIESVLSSRGPAASAESHAAVDAPPSEIMKPAAVSLGTPACAQSRRNVATTLTARKLSADELRLLRDHVSHCAGESEAILLLPGETQPASQQGRQLRARAEEILAMVADEVAVERPEVRAGLLTSSVSADGVLLLTCCPRHSTPPLHGEPPAENGHADATRANRR